MALVGVCNLWFIKWFSLGDTNLRRKFNYGPDSTRALRADK